ncbi:HAD family hydrolase [Sorangium sp. So ce131]|uniref:HAD family hydrolase n=1 Tax=Sorangium sp. So ce131 TaxID=3133282 RepID=UPI003F649196
MSEDGPPELPMAEWPQVHVLPGAREALEALHGAVTLCLATNATVSQRAMIERALDRAALLGFFSEIFCFTELGHRKESPLFWEAVARKLGLPPGQIAMIGDTLESDVLAPQRAGLQAAWLQPEADATLPSAGIRVFTGLPDFAAWVRQKA